mgnify:CR=1 FL=1
MLNLSDQHAIWLERMLSHQNMVTSYKAFWLKGILLELIENGHRQIAYDRIVHRMLVEAWYPVVQFKLNFGIQDQLGHVINYLQRSYHIGSDIQKPRLLKLLTNDPIISGDRDFKRQVKSLTQMVPYRLQSPFFSEVTKHLKDQSKNRLIVHLANQSHQVLYHYNEDLTGITISAHWADYIRTNQSVILGWLNHKLATYLQNKNLSVPNILSKLEPPVARSLSTARSYWDQAIRELNLIDLYTGLPLMPQQSNAKRGLSIDHFVPWSFVLHDELWNLVPTQHSINSAKNNRLPDLELYLDAFCLQQYGAFSHMRRSERWHGALEAYLNLGGALNTRAILRPENAVDQALFVNSLKNVILPLHQIAYNQGYEPWRYEQPALVADSNTTIQYYNDHAAQFIEGTIHADMSEHYVKFLKCMPAGGHILDAGCGSGRDVKHFLHLGYKVSAFDASKAMVDHAATYTGICIEHKTFDAFTAPAGTYDGIWANASLLHLNPEALKRVLRRFKEALSPDGVLYMSFKYGEETYEKDGRWFYNHTEESVERLTKEVGEMKVTEVYATTDVRPGRAGEQWVNVVVKRV